MVLKVYIPFVATVQFANKVKPLKCYCYFLFGHAAVSQSNNDTPLIVFEAAADEFSNFWIRWYAGQTLTACYFKEKVILRCLTVKNTF